jgi:hypothetical protein
MQGYIAVPSVRPTIVPRSGVTGFIDKMRSAKLRAAHSPAKHRVACVVVAGMAALPAAGLAQSPTRPVLGASAFVNANGSTVSFLADASEIKSDPLGLRRMAIGRPGGVSLRTPPSRATLGFVRFKVGDPSSPVTRKVALKRRVALGSGRYSLASSDGVRVVLSTRSRSAFISMVFLAEARTIRLSLTGQGARLLRSRRCIPQTFDARFETPSGRVFHDEEATIPSRILRRARLC